MWLHAARLTFARADFLRHDIEPGKHRIAKLGRDRDVGRVAPAGDNDTSDARDVVPGVEGEPASVEKHLEPGAEIHRRRVFRHADIAEIARAIARRNVHAAAERNGQMGEVAADAELLVVAFGRRAVTACMVVAELNAVMHIIADRLYTLPAARDRPEQRPGEIGQLLGVAIAAAVEERQDLVRQVLTSHCRASGAASSGRPLSSIRKSLRISRRPAGATNLVQVLPNGSRPCAGDDPWGHLNLVLTAQVFLA